MKTKNLFLSFLSCCVLQVNAQTYMPLLMPGNQWNVMHSFRTTAHEYNYDKTEQLKIVGDTTIGIINYKKLFFTDNEFGDNWALKGFIREDVKERKVYY
ncbi:MAG: hypothetical protein LBH22_08010, partial [Bacteroidales bacterium]|nr:hypothetical protein [Bacteroidales bacterium]